MRAEVDVRPLRERRAARARRRLLRAVPWRRVAAGTGGAVAVLVLTTGVVFAGSADRIAAGVTVAGMKVGGMTPAEAEQALADRARRYASVPVVFTGGGERWSLTPAELEARADWAAAADEARAEGNWPLPFRGVKRVAVRLLGADIDPAADVYDARLDHEVGRMADALDRPGRNAAIILDDLSPVVVAERRGRTLDQAAAKRIIVRALVRFDRAPVALPVRVSTPSVTAEDLERVVAQVETALSAPVRFGWRDAHWLVTPKELATLLELPANGRRDLRIGGREAGRYFRLLSRAVDRPPKNAEFVVTPSERVRIEPSAEGRKLDVRATAAALLAGALATDKREAELVVRTAAPALTTEKARAMKVTRVLATYTTAYSGSYDRIRNLQRATELVDGTRLASGATFSFNKVVGPRTAERGFYRAPMILDGEYKDAIGGGVSQVATTVFNAAWEAGVKITSRSPHSLYISRYPLGRDATVNWPDVDLKFQNDTKNWLVVKGTSGDHGITVSLLGAPTGRRVESEAGELKETGPPELEHVPDPTLFVGETVVVDEGEPSRAVTVRRVVYKGDKILYEETWYTSYRGEPKIVRVGTIPVPTPETPREPDKPNTQPTTTAPTTTAPTTTAPPDG